MIAAQVPEGILQIVEFNLHFGNAGAVCNAVSAHTFSILLSPTDFHL